MPLKEDGLGRFNHFSSFSAAFGFCYWLIDNHLVGILADNQFSGWSTTAKNCYEVPVEHMCPRSVQGPRHLPNTITSPKRCLCAGPSWRAMACCPVHLVSHITWEWRPALRGINSLLPYLAFRLVSCFIVAIIVIWFVVWYCFS